jgi:two-component sensor histidine kinase
MVRKLNHRFKNFLTMNSSVYNAAMMRHRERYGHKMLFPAPF